LPLPHQAYVIKLVPTDSWKTEPLSCEMQFIELELPRRLIFAVVQPRWCGLLWGRGFTDGQTPFLREVTLLDPVWCKTCQEDKEEAAAHSAARLILGLAVLE